MFSPIIIIGAAIAIYTVVRPFYSFSKNGNLNASLSLLWLMYNFLAAILTVILTAVFSYLNILNWGTFNWIVLFHYVAAVAILLSHWKNVGR
jgi:hypothetical protein